MQISHNPLHSQSSPLQSLRQSKELTGRNLVFIYPFLYDQSLAGYADILRKFFAVDITSQIKTSNVIHITSTVISPSSQNFIANPAQDVRRNLWHQDSLSQNSTPIPSYFNRDPNEKAQQLLINYNTFINNQIQHNPMYQELDPLVTSIVSDNMSIVPLIIGTKGYLIKSNALYWAILSALSTGLSLYDVEHIERLKTFIQHIPEENYTNFLFSPRAKLISGPGTSSSFPSKPSQNALDKFSKYVKVNNNKALNTLANIVDMKKWTDQIGGISSGNNMTLNEAPTISRKTQDKVYLQASASFHSYIANLLPQFVGALVTLLDQIPTGIDIPAKVNKLIYDLTEETKSDFVTLSEMTTQYLNTVKVDQQYQISTAAKILEDITNLCQDNVDIGKDVTKYLDSVEQVFNNYSHSAEGIIKKFIPQVMRISQACAAYSRKYEDWSKSLVANPTNLINNLKFMRGVKFSNPIHDFIYSDNYGEFSGPRIFNTYDGIGDNTKINNGVFGGERYNVLARSSDPPTIGQLKSNVKEIFDALVNIVYFLFLFNFFSYTCVFMRDIEVDVKIQKKDALDFPNYVFVLPLDLITALYHVWRSELFTQLTKNNPISEAEEEVLKIDNNQINRTIDLISKRFKVPNIMVVDQIKKEVYYKFMYMTSVSKLSLKTIESYTKHQMEVLPSIF